VISRLDNLTGHNGPLAAEPPGLNELNGLKKSGLARLNDAANTGLSLESRFDLAYNAAHALCLAALRSHGYRAKHRYIVFQVVPDTLGLGPEVWRILAKAHDTRNLGEYEGDLNVDKRFVTDLVAAVQAVAIAVQELPPPD
jgi:hypothetical protein